MYKFALILNIQLNTFCEASQQTKQAKQSCRMPWNLAGKVAAWILHFDTFVDVTSQYVNKF